MEGSFRVPDALLILTAGRALSPMIRLLVMFWLVVPVKARTVDPPPPVAVLVRIRLPSRSIVPPVKVWLAVPLKVRFPLAVIVVPAEIVYVPDHGVELSN